MFGLVGLVLGFGLACLNCCGIVFMFGNCVVGFSCGVDLDLLGLMVGCFDLLICLAGCTLF